MKADRLNDSITEKLTQARGVITLAQSYAAENEMFSFALQAALDLLKDVDRHAADLAEVAGAKNA